MEKLDRNFLLISALYGVLGMTLGLYMAGVESFKYTPVHSHITLFGFMSMAIYGICYRTGLAKNDGWAVAHLWVSAVGAIVFGAGEALALSGTTIAVAVIGSLLVYLASLQFVVALWRA